MCSKCKTRVLLNFRITCNFSSETDQWTSDEIEKYQQALWKCDKDFFAISKEVNWCFDDIIRTLAQKKNQQ